MIRTARALVVDLGGVACRWFPERRLAALAARSGLPAETVDQLVFGSGFDDAGERGRFTLFTFTAELAELLGLTLDDDTIAGLRADWALAYEPDPAVLKVVDQAATRTALLTNNGPLLEEALRHELAEVGGTFDELLLSWRLEATKPDPAAFAAAAAVLDLTPDQLFLVDDDPANVEAALAAEWHAHRYTDTINLRLALARAGIN